MNLKSFQYKLFFYIGSILCILLSILGCIAFYFIHSNIAADTLSASQELTNSTATNIDYIFSEMDKLALYSSTNPEIRETMSELQGADSDEVSSYNVELQDAVLDVLTSITVPISSSKYRITIFNEGNFIETTGIPTSSSILSTFTSSPDYHTWYDELPIINNNESLVFEDYDTWTNTDTSYITLYREIFHTITTNVSVGVVQVQCPTSVFIKLLEFDDPSIHCYVIDEEDTILFTDSDSDDEEATYVTDEELQAIVTSNYTIDNNVLYSANTLSNGWTLLIINSDSALTSLLTPIILYLIIGIILLLVITLIVIYIITHQTTKPLKSLINQVDQVSLSNLSINTSDTTFDEFELLNSAFSDMFDRLRNSMEENEKLRTYELQANLIALQSQMDPHFLYNILTVIKSMNREQNYDQIDFCCNYLAKMLRYISSYQETEVTLTRELEHAELYLNLMKFRYEDQFNFYINIEDDLDLDKIKINKLVIQPLLENCFQHGFKNVLPIWTIRVDCYT
ncbi:MAG: histidine kinase, partial [Eubacteriales bacterium]